MNADLLAAPLFAFFAFYVSLATVFIPLTFALTATLKEQYRRSMESPTLQAMSTRIFQFQRTFFYYNDAFAEAIVATSLVGLLAVAGVSWRFLFGAKCEAPEGDSETSLILLVFFVASLLLSLYMRRSHPKLYPRDRLTVDALWSFMRSPRVFSGGELRTEFERYAGHHERLHASTVERRFLPLHLLKLGNFAFIGTISAALYFGNSPEPAKSLSVEVALLAFFCHSAFTLGVWWELYVAWAPFSWLHDLESIAISPEYAKRFLEDPHRQQWATYSEFMHQYEEDDAYRASANQIEAMLATVGIEINERSVGLEEWKYAVIDDDPDNELLVLYVGCGHCGLLETLGDGIRSWFECERENFTIKMAVADSYTINHLPTPIDPKIRIAEKRIKDADAVPLGGDIFHVLRGMADNTRTVPRLFNGPEPTPEDRLLETKNEWDKLTKPPLVVLLNTTYGALIDPEWRQTESPEANDLLSERLARAQAASAEGFLVALGKVFKKTGFGLLVHSKKAGWLPGGTAPYTSDCWIQLKGTDSHKGLFLLGRFVEGRDAPSLMLCRWTSSGAFRVDIEASEAIVEAATNLRRVAVGSAAMDEDGNSTVSNADSRFLWSGAYFAPPPKTIAATWSRGELPSDYRPEAEAVLGKAAITTMPRGGCDVLDIGCGDGIFARTLMRSLSLEVSAYCGYEIDQRVGDKARETLHGDVESSTVLPFSGLEEWTPGDALWRLVLFWNVLPYLDPLSIGWVLRALKESACDSAGVETYVLISAFAEGRESLRQSPELAAFAAAKGARLDRGRRWLRRQSERIVRFGPLFIEGSLAEIAGRDVKRVYGEGAQGPFLRRRILFGRVLSPPTEAEH